MKRLLFLALVLALASIACGSEASAPVVVATAKPDLPDNFVTEPPVINEPPVPTAAPIKNYNVGDSISIGDIILIVNGVTFPVGDQYTKPEAGKKFIVIDLTIENKGATSYNISSMLQMTLKDDTGQKYDMDFSASMASGGSTPDGEIVAGDKLRGQIGFQIPENATGLVFIFDYEVFGEGQVRVSIPNQ